MYDAIVAADGSGDYLTPALAFANTSITTIWIRSGTYTGGTVTLPPNAVIDGEDMHGVFIENDIDFSNAGTITNTGTISVPNNSLTVTGTGTEFYLLEPN